MGVVTPLAGGKSPAWAGLLRDWERSLRAGSHPATTRYIYLLAAAQLADDVAVEDAGSGGASDPALVTKRLVEKGELNEYPEVIRAKVVSPRHPSRRRSLSAHVGNRTAMDLGFQRRQKAKLVRAVAVLVRVVDHQDEPVDGQLLAV